MCLTGQPIKCGSKVRLEHMGTSRNLHSHSFESPVSKRQEVSCFGEQGDGDEGDNWIIECQGKLNGDLIDGKTSFYLKHFNSAHYLYTDSRSLFDQQNCRNCPSTYFHPFPLFLSSNHHSFCSFCIYPFYQIPYPFLLKLTEYSCRTRRSVSYKSEE
jgi:hypothetical protein